MTEAQYNKPRLRVWKELLASIGGTPRANDTLYQTVRKVLIALGGSIPCCNLPSFHQLAKAILAISPDLFADNGKLNGTLLPQAGIALPWGTGGTTVPIEPNALLLEGSGYVLNENGQPILLE